MKKLLLLWPVFLLFLLGIQPESQAQNSLSSPMNGLNSTGSVTSYKIVPLPSNAYAIVGKFTGNMTALGQTITSFGNEDCFIALYYPPSGNTAVTPMLTSVFILGGTGNDELLTGDTQGSTLFLGGSYTSSSISFKLYRQGFAVISGQLPSLSKNNSNKIGFLMSISTFGNGLLANANNIKTATITASDGAPNNAATAVNGLSFCTNNGSSSVFVTGAGNATLLIKGSNGAVSTLTNAFGPYISRFDNNLQHVTTATPGDQTATLSGYGSHLKAVALGNGYHVYVTGLFSGPLRPNVNSSYNWDNHFVAKISFSSTATSSWMWAKSWAVNNSISPVTESKGLVIVPNSVIVLNRANDNAGGPTKFSYLVKYDMGSGAQQYSKRLEVYANQNCLSYYNGSLYLGGHVSSISISFGTAPGPVASKPAGSSGIYFASYDYSTGNFTRLWAGLSSTLPTATCNNIYADGCRIFGTGSFQGSLLGVSSANNGGFFATTETSSLILNQPNVIFCPNVPSFINITAQPAPTNTVWATTAAGVSLTPNGNNCTVYATDLSPNTFTVTATALVGTCSRLATFTFNRSSDCLYGGDRSDNSDEMNSDVPVSAAPNPFSHTLLLSGIRQVQKVEILNMEGRVFYQNESPERESLEISTYDWPNGIYLYRTIGTDNQVNIGKLIKQ